MKRRKDLEKNCFSLAIECLSKVGLWPSSVECSLSYDFCYLPDFTLYILYVLMVWAREELNCANRAILSVRVGEGMCLCHGHIRMWCMWQYAFICFAPIHRIGYGRVRSGWDWHCWTLLYDTIHNLILDYYSPLNSYLYILHNSNWICFSIFSSSTEWMHIGEHNNIWLISI